jgi:hypothetical protein
MIKQRNAGTQSYFLSQRGIVLSQFHPETEKITPFKSGKSCQYNYSLIILRRLTAES